MNVVERKVTTVGGLLDMNLNLDPEYQRKKVWAKKKKIELIATIFRGDSINTIHTRAMGARDEVLDGKQRLTTIQSFLKSEDVFKGSKVVTEDEVATIRNHEVTSERHLGLSLGEAIERFRTINKGTPLTSGERRHALRSRVNAIIAPYKDGWLERLFQSKRSKDQENLEKILFYCVKGIEGATQSKLDTFHEETNIDDVVFNTVMGQLSSVFTNLDNAGDFKWWDLAHMTHLLVHYNKNNLHFNLDESFLESWAKMKGDCSNIKKFSKYKDKRDLTKVHMHFCVSEFKKKFEKSRFWTHGDVTTKIAKMSVKKKKAKK